MLFFVDTEYWIYLVMNRHKISLDRSLKLLQNKWKKSCESLRPAAVVDWQHLLKILYACRTGIDLKFHPLLNLIFFFQYPNLRFIALS